MKSKSYVTRVLPMSVPPLSMWTLTCAFQAGGSACGHCQMVTTAALHFPCPLGNIISISASHDFVFFSLFGSQLKYHYHYVVSKIIILCHKNMLYFSHYFYIIWHYDFIFILIDFFGLLSTSLSETRTLFWSQLCYQHLREDWRRQQLIGVC